MKTKQYETEAKERWGKTTAWREYEQKTNGISGEWEEETTGLMNLFAEIGKLRTLPMENAAVKAGIAKLQAYITEHFYTCTDEIFAGLGELYVADERFKEKIDRAGGPGTAEFVSKAIQFYYIE